MEPEQLQINVQVLRSEYPESIRGLGGSQDKQDKKVFEDFAVAFNMGQLVYQNGDGRLSPFKQLQDDFELVSFHSFSYGYDLKVTGDAFTVYLKQIVNL